MDFFLVSVRVRQVVAYLLDVSYTDTLERNFLQRAVQGLERVARLMPDIGGTPGCLARVWGGRR